MLVSLIRFSLLRLACLVTLTEEMQIQFLLPDQAEYCLILLFYKGYALIEYENFEEAQNAITAMNGTELLTQTINVDWAFSNGPSTGPFKRKNMRSGRTHRSRSPRRRY
ncbi:hypothetical protein JRO89_XSUnG0252700 [Xanthoceras sorbifolium]|uniref:RRM domain-containing protein n=1 Tax=Xanthoceras sorbifolium TaxID=99658 RepID=A0ABQ8GWN8_9ROSI|nr:hypothetical protein JRO89_XSUnG0252700 [Xanthoceras sorbifolium]